MTSLITSVLRCKKTLAGENRGRRDDSAEETTEADETIAAGKAKPTSEKDSFFLESLRCIGTVYRFMPLLMVARYQFLAQRPSLNSHMVLYKLYFIPMSLS